MTGEKSSGGVREGGDFGAQRYFGAHRSGEGYIFRVWAPRSERVCLIGSFNGWSESTPMRRLPDCGELSGIWEAYAPASPGDRYKYRIYRGGRAFDKADPYASACEAPPASASVIYETEGFEWGDREWLRERAERMGGGNFYSRPINIYELHPLSWRRHADGSNLSYAELALELAPYLKQMGYTHVELMPVAEHPYNPSWGYQVTGYFAPTARFGSPRDFMGFVDYMHRAGIGVILDWVPGHFPKDDFGLFEFDGGPLYEYSSPERRENRGWGTRNFDLGRREVARFLFSSAAHWIELYHADGLRVDAVASMLYLDYDRREGEWSPNEYGDNRCLEAVSFFKRLNGYMAENHPDVLMIAEESSEWPHVTSLRGEGLGFSLKWNMGWMHDSLNYMSLGPEAKKKNARRLSFSLSYAFGERYMLPLSHDEVVHGKRSLLGRMPGGYSEKFAAARVFALWTMTHPGKKISFMGNEIGQFAEWDFNRQIEWFLLDYEAHARHQLYHASLNHFYLAHLPLWEEEGGWSGFEWIDPDTDGRCVFSFRRRSASGEELIILLNFSDGDLRGFELGVPGREPYFELFNSDDEKFGGGGRLNPGPHCPREPGRHNLPRHIKLDLPPLTGLVLGRER